MASQSFIIEHEKAIADAIGTVRALTDAYHYERGVYNDKANPDNHEVWGTLHANLYVLCKRCEYLLDEMKGEFNE